MSAMLFEATAEHPSETNFSPYAPGMDKADPTMKSNMIKTNRTSQVIHAQHLCIVNDVQQARTPTRIITPITPYESKTIGSSISNYLKVSLPPILTP